jgi:hypothetical protein
VPREVSRFISRPIAASGGARPVAFGARAVPRRSQVGACRGAGPGVEHGAAHRTFCGVSVAAPVINDAALSIAVQVSCVAGGKL